MGVPRARDSAKWAACFAVTLAGMGGFEGIDERLDERRSRRRQGLVEDRAAVLRFLDREARAAAGPREAGEVDRVQVAAVFGIPEEDHLLRVSGREFVVLKPPGQKTLGDRRGIHPGREPRSRARDDQPREFATAVKYKLPIKIVVVKNNTLGQIKWRWPSRRGCPRGSEVVARDRCQRNLRGRGNSEGKGKAETISRLI